MEYLTMVVRNTLKDTVYKDIPAEDIICNLPSTVESAKHLNDCILSIAARLKSNDSKA